MSNYQLKIDYYRGKEFGMSWPFFHSYLEISQSKKKPIRIGYYVKNKLFFIIGLLLPVPGELRIENKKADYKIIISKDKNKIKKVLEQIKENNWTVFHSIFRNCFHWRNRILKSAGIKPPRYDWFFKRRL